MFADGGITSLGANAFNMALVNVCGGYLAYRAIRALIPLEPTRSTLFAGAFAGWLGTVLASVSCAGQLALSQTAPWQLAFPAMVNIHMIIGLGEGLATGLVLLAIFRTRPDLLTGLEPAHSGFGPLLGYGLVISAGLALFVAPFACPWPDGLEAVAHQLGFSQHSAPGPGAPFADYQLPFIGSPTVATAAAGCAGTVIAFIGAYLLARLLVPVLDPAKKDAPN
jgi:cobalt/nickel transport system permease protein